MLERFYLMIQTHQWDLSLIWMTYIELSNWILIMSLKSIHLFYFTTFRHEFVFDFKLLYNIRDCQELLVEIGLFFWFVYWWSGVQGFICPDWLWGRKKVKDYVAWLDIYRVTGRTPLQYRFNSQQFKVLSAEVNELFYWLFINCFLQSKKFYAKPYMLRVALNGPTEACAMLYCVILMWSNPDLGSTVLCEMCVIVTTWAMRPHGTQAHRLLTQWQ